MKSTHCSRRSILFPSHFDMLESRLLLSAQTVSTWDMFPLIDNADRIYQTTVDGRKSSNYNEHISIKGDLINLTDKAMVPGDSGDNVRWLVEHGNNSIYDGVYLDKMWADSFSLKLNSCRLLESTLTVGTSSSGNTDGSLFIVDIGSFTVYGTIKRTVMDWTTVTVPSGQYDALQVQYVWSISGSRMIYVPEIHQSVDVGIYMSIDRTDYLVAGIGSVKFSENDSVSISIAGGLATQDHSQSVAGELLRTKNVSEVKPYVQVTGVEYKSGVFDNSKPFAVNVSEIYRTINVYNENYQVSAVLSRDKIWGNEDDIVIQQGQAFSPLSTGKTQKLALSTSLDPTLVSPGPYYVGVRLDDSTTLATNDATSNIWWSAKADVNVLNMVDLRVVNGDLKAAESTGAQQVDETTYRINRLNNDGEATMAIGFNVSGTATRGKDYVLQVNGQTITGNSVTLGYGMSYVDIVVVPLDDAAVEKVESITLSLKPNTKMYGIDALHSKASVSLEDLTVPVISVKTSRNTAEKYESTLANYGMLTFTRAGGDITQETKVLVQLTGSALAGDDYLLLNSAGETVSVNEDGTALITFAPGAKNTVVYVKPVNDILKEGTEKLELTILPETGSPTYRPDMKAVNIHAVVSIADNDLATDSLAGKILSLSGSAREDGSKSSTSISQKIYMDADAFVSQFKNAVSHGTYNLTKAGGNTLTLTAAYDNGDAYICTLIFTSATIGRLTGTATLGGKSVTLSGSFSLSLPAIPYAPSTLNSQTLHSIVSASNDKTNLRTKVAWTFEDNQMTTTTLDVSTVYTCAYSAVSSFGLLKRVDSGARVSWTVLIFGKGKTGTFITANDDQDSDMWMSGTFKLAV